MIFVWKPGIRQAERMKQLGVNRQLTCNLLQEHANYKYRVVIGRDCDIIAEDFSGNSPVAAQIRELQENWEKQENPEKKRKNQRKNRNKQE